jgi:hypothetical protein
MRSLFPLFFALFLAGCPKNDPPRPDASADAGAEASASGGDDVEPVYAIEPNAPPVPLAEKLCAALNETQEKKRAACCKSTPGIVVNTECSRMLGAALRASAVDLAPADVDACVAAWDKTLEGCDWVGPFPPAPPAPCMGIIKGKIASGKKCRSSLECSGSLRCLGVGPTTPGHCGPPKASGELCGGTVDPLVGFTLHTNELDKLHPECAPDVRCIKHRCAAPAAEGAACQTTSDCKDGLQCVPAVAGAPKLGAPARACKAAALPKQGEPCPGGVCGEGLSCIKNTCTSRKATGEACSADFECRGGCLKPDGGAKGTCGPRCDIR